MYKNVKELSDGELLCLRDYVDRRLNLANVHSTGREWLKGKKVEVDSQIDSRGIVERVGGYEE
jgi:hypothetical protein